MRQNRKISLIKITGLSVSMYEQFESIANYQIDFLAEINDPLDDRWLDYLLNTTFNLISFLSFEGTIENKEKFKRLLIQWLKGNWFGTLAAVWNSTVDDLLKFFNEFINNKFQNAVAGLVRYIENKRAEEGLLTSSIISEWSNYLHHGVKNKTELSLIEIGICDRIGAIEIADWLISNDLVSDTHEDLKSIVYQNKVAIENALTLTCPKISMIVFRLFIQNYDLFYT